MKKAVSMITPDILRELIEYHPDSGRFFWKMRERKWFKDERSQKIWNTKFAGKETFTTNDGDGYRMSSVLHVKVKAHRVAWAIHYGETPSCFLDHINTIKDDNRISNLRLASNSENMCNTTKRADNTSGVKGVYWCKEKSKWCAEIKKNGKKRFLGRFIDIDQARLAYEKASKMYHGEFARTDHE